MNLVKSAYIKVISENGLDKCKFRCGGCQKTAKKAKRSSDLMRLKLLKGFTALLMLFGSFFAVSCGNSTAIKGIHMSNSERIDVPYGNFSYEGIKVTVDFENGTDTEIDLTEEMIPEIEKLKFFKMGNQDVEVTFRSKYSTTMPVNVVLNKFNDIYALEGYDCVYDGLPHSVKLNHELPEGATITYPYGNVFSNAGTYKIVGVISKKGYESKTLTTTLNILQAERDVSSIVFEDKIFVYNGEMKTVEATNVPSDIEVTYDYLNYTTGTKVNKVVNAGKYKAVAHFNLENTNYKKIPDMEAILTIEKADYDMSKIELKNVTKEYDGQEYSASISNPSYLPTGVSVKYTYLNEAGNPVTSNAKAGKYTIVAEFIGGDSLNYNPIEPLKATLTVSKRVIKISDKITFESKTVNFDENTVHSIFIEGTLPDTVEVSYENNGQQYVGEYLITAKFTAKNENDTVDVEEMSAYLVINRVRRSVKVYNDATEQYDLDFSPANIHVEKPNVTITGYDTTVFELVSVKFFLPSNSEIVEPADFQDGVKYEYIITFAYIDENLANSVILAEESDLFEYIEA